MPNLRIAIIPAAGRAVRLNGLPKFLLPIPGHSSLLSYHLEMALTYADVILVPTRPEFASMVSGISNAYNAKTLILDTQTLTETIYKSVIGFEPETLTIQLPDTFIQNSIAFRSLEQLARTSKFTALAAWKSTESQRGKLGQVLLEEDQNTLVVKEIVDKNPNFFPGRHWGSISFYRPDLSSWDLTEPTIGNIVSRMLSRGERIIATVSETEYVDLGTTESLIEFYSNSSQINF